MRFAWSRADADPTADASEQTDEAPYELAAVELLTEAGRRMGWIATQGQRTSDWLNAHDQVPFLGLTDAEAAPTHDAAPPAPPAQGEPTHLERSRIVWAVPPPLPPNRHLRLHRRRVLVHLELDDWEVSGQAHVRPGADATDQVLRGTRDMVPLTDVQVVSREDRGRGAALPVLIVNRVHVSRIVVDAPHASAPVAAPVDEGPVAMRLAALGVTAEPEDVPAGPEREDVPAVPEPSTAESAESPGTPIESGTELVQSALEVLLETGVIDVVEFQSFRARLPAIEPGTASASDSRA